jgi:hypothetical protein
MVGMLPNHHWIVTVKHSTSTSAKLETEEQMCCVVHSPGPILLRTPLQCFKLTSQLLFHQLEGW